MPVAIIFPIEFWLPGVPVSSQASAQSRERWKARIEAIVRQHLPEGHFLTDEPIAVTIFYFSDSQMVGDLDNIIKPILDSFVRVVYIDDAQVERIFAHKFEPGRNFSFQAPNPVLAEAINSDGPRVYLSLDIAYDGVEI